MEQGELYEDFEEYPEEAERLGLKRKEWDKDPAKEESRGNPAKRKIINFCNVEGPMSVCLKHENKESQQGCDFYDPRGGGKDSSKKCLYLHFDENCDNFRAQDHAKKRKSDD